MLKYINGGLQSKLATTFTYQNNKNHVSLKIDVLNCYLELCFIWGNQSFLKERVLIRKGCNFWTVACSEVACVLPTTNELKMEDEI